MTSKQKTILAFDVYGTVLSTESIARKLATFVGEEKSKAIAKSWRKYQLEYTWRCNSMGIFLDFMMLTRRSFTHALLEANASLTEAQTAEVVDAYTSLSTFPDASPAFKELSSREDIQTVLFSNGTRPMIEANISNSTDLSTYRQSFSEIVVVEDVRKYKPAPEAYHFLAQKFGVGELDVEGLDAIWLVSSNPFDVVGARGVGMKAIWVDRTGEGWMDNLQPGMRGGPSEIVRSLEEVVGVVEKYRGRS